MPVPSFLPSFLPSIENHPVNAKGVSSNGSVETNGDKHTHVNKMNDRFNFPLSIQ